MLTRVADGLHTATDLLALPAGVKLPVRMTVVALPDGGSLLYSPLAPSEALVASVQALGPVRHILAPNRLHHLHAGAWVKCCPSARLWGAPGLSLKRPELPWNGTLGDEPPPEWREVLDQRLLQGAPKLNEVVLYHGPSRTLICADMLFNVRKPANLASTLALTLTGTRGRLALSRAWRLYTKDRRALRASVESVLAWDIARLLPAHGDLDEGAEPSRLRGVLAWALAGKGERLQPVIP